jgi:hypothetical protein
MHDGPGAYEEVLQEDRRPIPGVKEEEVKAWLDKGLGKFSCLGSLASQSLILFRNKDEWLQELIGTTFSYRCMESPVVRTCGGYIRCGSIRSSGRREQLSYPFSFLLSKKPHPESSHRPPSAISKFVFIVLI